MRTSITSTGSLTGRLRNEGNLSANINKPNVKSVNGLTGDVALNAYHISMTDNPDVTVGDKLDILFDKYNCKKMQYLQPYLYEVWYDNIDYDYAKEYFESLEEEEISGACSAVRNGRYFGRKFDWSYNEQASFIVHSGGVNGAASVIGIAGAMKDVTPAYIDANPISPIYKAIPFKIQDGINEYGLVCETNVVPLDKGVNISIPLIEKREEVNGRMLVRYILDHFKSALEAVEYIKNYVSVFFANALHEMHFEQHYLLADKTSTYVLEFVENQAVYHEIPYITNFYIDGVEFNNDGTVGTPQTINVSNPITKNKITPYGAGLERFNLIVNNYNLASTHDGMQLLLDELNYTNSYKEETSPYWYSEFVDPNRSLTCASPLVNFQPIVAAAQQAFVDRTRDGTFWQSVHSVIYDIYSKTLEVSVQEEARKFSRTINNFTEKMNEIVGNLEDLITEDKTSIVAAINELVTLRTTFTE